MKTLTQSLSSAFQALIRDNPNTRFAMTDYGGIWAYVESNQIWQSIVSVGVGGVAYVHVSGENTLAVTNEAFMRYYAPSARFSN